MCVCENDIMFPSVYNIASGNLRHMIKDSLISLIANLY